MDRLIGPKANVFHLAYLHIPHLYYVRIIIVSPIVHFSERGALNWIGRHRRLMYVVVRVC